MVESIKKHCANKKINERALNAWQINKTVKEAQRMSKNFVFFTRIIMPNFFIRTPSWGFFREYTKCSCISSCGLTYAFFYFLLLHNVKIYCPSKNWEFYKRKMPRMRKNRSSVNLVSKFQLKKRCSFFPCNSEWTKRLRKIWLSK